MTHSFSLINTPSRLIILAVLIGTTPSFANTEIELELGLVKTGFNYFKRPNDNVGTRVDLESGKAQTYGRLQGYYHFNNQHALRFLAAPLAVDYQQTATTATRYGDTTFPAGSQLDIRYQFNSYRLGYVYTLSSSNNHNISIGFTGKIRDAMIRVNADNLNAEFSNVGFVPLFYAAAETTIHQTLIIGMQADGAAAPQGGAIDLSLYAGVDTDYEVSIKFGGRYLEGGADNDSLVGFAQFWYGFGSLSMKI